MSGVRYFAALVAVAIVGPAAQPAGAGELVGSVTLELEGVRLSALGTTVVFLEGGAPGLAVPAFGAPPKLSQHNARFEPEFLVVPVGGRVEMPNQDTIFHNVFSFSRPNEFDLGIYPSGESRSVVFRHAGLVRVYCSIHESMSATVLVAPSPWFATVSPSGEYRIPDVPAGRYRLTAWNEKLPESSQPVTVGSGTLRADLALGAVSP